METQQDYNVDFNLDYNSGIFDDIDVKAKNQDIMSKEIDILKDNSTDSLFQRNVGLKPTREIIRGSVIYEQDGNNN